MDIIQTRELVHFVIQFGNALGASLEDGKVGMSDLGHFFGAMTSAAAAFSNMQEIPKELKDLDAAEKMELLLMIEEEFDIPQDELETTLERVLKTGVAIAELIADLMKSNKKTA